MEYSTEERVFETDKKIPNDNYLRGSKRVVIEIINDFLLGNQAVQLDEVLVGKLFNRFYTVTTAKKSTGLGLSIAKGLTEQMNGKITASYKEGSLSIHLLFPLI